MTIILVYRVLFSIQKCRSLCTHAAQRLRSLRRRSPKNSSRKHMHPNPNSNSEAQSTAFLSAHVPSQRMIYRVARLGGGGVALSNARSKSRIVCAIDLCASWTDWARCLNGGSSARKSSKRCCCSCAVTAGSWSSRKKCSELLQMR
jgi:hypothetical protein